MFICMYVCTYVCVYVFVRISMLGPSEQSRTQSTSHAMSARMNIRKRGSGKRKLDLPYADGYYSD